jgi:hypothetical protein
MLRVLTIAVACIAGAAMTWVFVPTDQMPSMGQMSFGPAEADAEPELGGQQEAQLTTPMIGNDERHQRAEQLVGEELKYITGGDAVHDVAWVRDLGPKRIERAMDECFLITDKFLYNAHWIAQHGDPAADLDPAKVLAMPFPSDLVSCKNAITAYYEMHGKEFNF